NTAFKQLDIEYTEDTAIQRFYRGLVRKNLDYAFQHHKETLAACNGHADKGVNEAATDALNSMYARVMKEPRWATCTAYLDGDVTIDGVIQEMKKPTVLVIGGDSVASYVSVVYNAKDYGLDYLKREVKSRCETVPDERLWNAFSDVSAPVANKLYEEAREAAEAERKKKAEEERADRLARYSNSLYASGTATCENFREQAQWASFTSDQDSPTFLAGLRATVADMPRPEKQHQREAFEKALSERFEDTVRSIVNYCGSDTTPEAAVLQTRVVTEAKTPYYLELEALLETKRYADSCGGNASICQTGAEHAAAQRVFDDGVACENGQAGKDVLCFAVPAEAYAYQLAVIQVDLLTTKRDEVKKKLSPEASAREVDFYMEPCKQRVIQRGFRGDEYYAEVERVCPGEALQAYLEPVKVELAKAEKDLEDKQAEVATAKLKASPIPQS
ncbi:hypothetical protein ABLT09_28600, partial [Pseudomonas aeruginosa]